MPAERVMELCELEPCQNQATLSVGTGKKNWHLCAWCADQTMFKRLRKRVPLKGKDAGA